MPRASTDSLLFCPERDTLGPPPDHARHGLPPADRAALGATGSIRLGDGSIAMKTHKGGVVIGRLDEGRCAVLIDGIVRYVGTQEECERRVAILAPKNDRAAQDEALGRLMR
jgi:hypothetical protein